MMNNYDQQTHRAGAVMARDMINGSRTTTDDNATPPRFAEAQLSTGVKLHYAEQGDPAAHPIILLHGYTDSWFSFSRVMGELARTYRVYALDQRGHGDSDQPEDGYALTDYAADVLAFMDALGLRRVSLVGHSMGSLVARRVALAAPERVARLVLVASTNNVRNNGVLELQRAVEMMEDPVPVEFVREFQESTIYHPVPEEFMDEVVRTSLKLPARVWRGAMGGMLADNLNPLVRVPNRTLILWGDRDTIFSRAEQDALAATFADAVLKVYPKTGHALHWERPEQFVRDIENFIQR